MQAGRPWAESPQSGTCVDMSPCDQTAGRTEKVLFRDQTCKCFFFHIHPLGQIKQYVFRLMGLKILGRVGTHIIRIFFFLAKI